MLLCAEATLARLWPQKRRPAQKQSLAQESCSESLERPPTPPLLPPCPRLCPPGEVSSLFRRDQMHSGRWPGRSGQQDAGPHKNARNQPQPLQPRPLVSDRSLPGSAHLHSGPAASPSPGTPRFRSAALPSPPAPSGPLEPTSFTLRVPSCLPGGLPIPGHVCSHVGGVNTVFIQLTLSDIYLWLHAQLWEEAGASASAFSPGKEFWAYCREETRAQTT